MSDPGDLDGQQQAAESRKKILWASGAAAVLLILGLVGWQWGYPIYTHLKVQHLQGAAQDYFDRKDYRNAVFSARLALMLDTNNVTACRIMTECAELAGSPVALDWRERLAKLEPTLSNRLALASASLQYQPPPHPWAAQILEELAATPATNLVPYHLLATALAIQQQQVAAAERHLRNAQRLAPTNRVLALNLAVVQLRSTNPAVLIAARQTLEQFRTDPELNAAALRSLQAERCQQQDYAGAATFATQILASAAATLGDHLQYLDLLQKLASPDLPAQLATVQRLAQTNAPAAAQVAAWMQANRQGDDSARWLQQLPASVRAQPMVQMALANAYLITTNWPELCRMTAKSDWSEMNFLRLALLGLAFNGLGEPLLGDGQWRSALELTGNRTGALTALLRLAETYGSPSLQAELLHRLLQQQPGNQWAQQKLEQLQLAAGNTRELYEFYLRQLTRSPDSPALKNNAAATALLLKTNLAQAQQWAAELYAQRPADPVIVSTYAFALHLQGRDAEGLAAFDRVSPARREEPAVALYYGVLLRANGQNETARRYLTIAKQAPNLLPEEQQLLKGD